ncbi:MAG: response regulator [Legionellales bacterium]|jgi:DNA-binding response OmpR family regulator
MYTRSQKKILLIEDDIMVQFAERELLDHAGFNVDAACDGSDGLSLYRYYHYDMVLLDINLPDISGFEVARLIREFEHARKKKPVEIIALTATPDKYPPHLFTAAGINRVFNKPIDADSLDPIFTDKPT